MHNWERLAASDANLCTYQLCIVVARARILTVGQLGIFRFPVGRYVYTGSARCNLISRVRRHLSHDKKLRWHIDYLLAAYAVKVVDVVLSNEAECTLVSALVIAARTAAVISNDWEIVEYAFFRYSG